MRETAGIPRRVVLLVVAVFMVLTLARLPGSAGWLGPAGMAITALAPAHAGLLVAAFLPLASTIAGWFAMSLPAGEIVVIAFLGGIALRWGALGIATSGAVPRALPLLALVLVVSFAVPLAGLADRMGDDHVELQLGLLAAGRYFDPAFNLGHQPVAWALQALGLGAAMAALLTRFPAWRPPLVRMLAAGAAGAAALNIARVVSTALASGDPAAALPGLLGAMRIDTHFGDVNAAASYFALTFFCAAAWAARQQHGLRVSGVSAAAAIALALWLTSSRAAIVSVLVTAIAAAAGYALRHRPGARQMLLGGGLLAIAAGLVVVFLPNAVFGEGTSVAVAVRRDMAIASLKLFGDAPLFGIGVGRFYEASGEAIRDLPVGQLYHRENAHNNFLQILAETGLVGFALFAIVVGAFLRRAWAGIRQQVDLPELAGILAGVVAFLFSATLGHPLLIAPVAYVFWIALGTAGAGPRPLRPTPARRHTSLALAAAVGILLSWPIRAHQYVLEQDLDHIGHGLSPWQFAEEMRFRTATGAATVFVPASAAAVEIPLYVELSRPVTVAIFVNDVLVNRAMLPGEQWTPYRLVLGGKYARRFVPVRLEIQDGSQVTFRVGKVRAVDPVR